MGTFLNNIYVHSCLKSFWIFCAIAIYLPSCRRLPEPPRLSTTESNAGRGAQVHNASELIALLQTYIGHSYLVEQTTTHLENSNVLGLMPDLPNPDPTQTGAPVQNPMIGIPNITPTEALLPSPRPIQTPSENPTPQYSNRAPNRIGDDLGLSSEELSEAIDNDVLLGNAAPILRRIRRDRQRARRNRILPQAIPTATLTQGPPAPAPFQTPQEPSIPLQTDLPAILPTDLPTALPTEAIASEIAAWFRRSGESESSANEDEIRRISNLAFPNLSTQSPDRYSEGPTAQVLQAEAATIARILYSSSPEIFNQSLEILTLHYALFPRMRSSLALLINQLQVPYDAHSRLEQGEHLFMREVFQRSEDTWNIGFLLVGIASLNNTRSSLLRLLPTERPYRVGWREAIRLFRFNVSNAGLDRTSRIVLVQTMALAWSGYNRRFGFGPQYSQLAFHALYQNPHEALSRVIGQLTTWYLEEFHSYWLAAVPPNARSERDRNDQIAPNHPAHQCSFSEPLSNVPGPEALGAARSRLEGLRRCSERIRELRSEWNGLAQNRATLTLPTQSLFNPEWADILSHYRIKQNEVCQYFPGEQDCLNRR